MNDNVIVASFSDARHETRTRRVYQYDYGMVLTVDGIDLPTAFEAHFSNTDDSGTSVTQIGSDGAVDIPDEYLLTGLPVYCWIYLHTGEDDGETVYKITIPVKKRAQPTNEEPTPVQQDAITQAIAALNSAVTQTGQDAESAEASASDAADSAEEAKGYKEAAQTSATNAARSDSSAASAAYDASLSARSAVRAAGVAGTCVADAQTAAQSAHTYADSAATSAQAAQASAQSIQSMSVEAETLAPGSQATAEWSDGTLSLGIPKGDKGLKGDPGDPGYSPTASVSKSGNATTITVTDKTGTTTATILDGAKGDPGDPGTSPTASVSKSGTKSTITITDEEGTTTAEVLDGENGIPGVSPTIAVSDIPGGHRVTITDADHPGGISFDVMDGGTGNGISSAVLNQDYTLTLNFTDGTSYTTSSIRGEKGEKGDAGEVASLNSIAPDYSQSSTYAVGDYCIYNDLLYVCLTTISTAEAWTASHWMQVNVTSVLSDLNDALTQVESLMPTSGSDWTAYTYTPTSGYINRSGVQGASQYSNFVTISYDGESDFKISGKVPNNATICPVVYKNSGGDVIGTEPATSETTLTDYELTIPVGTATIYLNYTPGGTPFNIYKMSVTYVKAAAESTLNGKLNKPVSDGTNGQVLKTDGSGGVSWGDVPVDATLAISGKSADAKTTGDRIKAVEEKIPIEYSVVSATPTTGKFMKLDLTEGTNASYKYVYVAFDGLKYKVTTKAACNTTLAPIIYVDGNGNYAGRYPVETSSSDVTILNELLDLPSGAVGMYINNNGGATDISVYKGVMQDVEGATDYSTLTWNAIGDSITQNGYYMAEVNSILGLPYTNGGVASTTLAINDTYLTGQSIVERVLAGTYTDKDVWTVMGGLNDCLYKSTLGQLVPTGSTFDKTTVYGALQAICEYILNLRAHPRLVLITPTQSVRDTWSAETYPTTMAQIRKAVIDVGEYYSVPVFDAWAESGVCAYNLQKQTNPTTSDGVHLNTLGADILGEKLALVIKDVLFGINDD